MEIIFLHFKKNYIPIPAHAQIHKEKSKSLECHRLWKHLSDEEKITKLNEHITIDHNPN